MGNIFYVINTTDIDIVDFEEIVQNPSTVRYSLDNSKFIIKTTIDGNIPSFISDNTIIPVFTGDSSEIGTYLEDDAWRVSEL